MEDHIQRPDSIKIESDNMWILKSSQYVVYPKMSSVIMKINQEH